MDDARSGYSLDSRALAVRSAFGAGSALVMDYLRADLDDTALPSGPALIVVNHGFGTIFDINVLAAVTILSRAGLWPDEPALILAHDTAWKIGIGPILERCGLRPANPHDAVAALRAGHKVFVMPGGDREAAKPWSQRNRVMFNGRTGFARVAAEAGAPVVPIVVTGAGDTLMNLSPGTQVARWSRLDRLFRIKTLPINVCLPWGFNVGLAQLGYLPWPAKVRTRVLDSAYPPTAVTEQSVRAFAARVERDMDSAARELTAGRHALLDWWRPNGDGPIGARPVTPDCPESRSETG